jgi:polyferredoxin
MGKWRASVLVAVHLAILARIGWWLWTGRAETLTPVEPSEAAYTLRDGAINAGFVLFALAIVSTLILGRWFCGWACHIVALQDLCGWMMKKVGVRPKPFRARLLMWMPLALALYMFVWPTALREAVAPAAQRAGVWTAVAPYVAYDPASPFPSPVFHSGGQGLAFFRPEFKKKEFWETFPHEWYIIVPFLGVCGFAAVYFLGSKGFCTYGCPYGGFFAPADKLAPMRIRVTDACNHCGHCTAACTSNVRVHEEVRDYGMVVDPGCMKCLDCVSVCPNDALYFGPGRPSAFARPRSEAARERGRFRTRIFDLTWGQELAVTGVFVGLLMAYRGMFDRIPLLMAVGMAGVGAFLFWKLWALVSEPSVRIQSLQLKLKGRPRPWGVVFGALAVCALLAAAWSGLVRYSHWRAGILDARIDQAGVSYERVFAKGYTPEPSEAARARAGLAHFARGLSMSEGGMGWRRSVSREVEISRRMAWLASVAGDWDRAKGCLERGVERSNEDPSISVADLVQGLLQIDANMGKRAAETLDRLEALGGRAPRVFELHLLLAQFHARLNQPAKAEASALAAAAALEEMGKEHPERAEFRGLHGQALAMAGRLDEAAGQFARAVELSPQDPGLAGAYAQVLGALGRAEESAWWQERARSLQESGSGRR